MELRLSLSGEMPSESLAKMFSGAGLVRGEFIFRYYERYVTDQSALLELEKYISSLCTLFRSTDVWYRLSDIWSDELPTLTHDYTGSAEQNPIIGCRGIRRILKYRDHFSGEIDSLCRNAKNHKNLHLILPFVQDGDEMNEGIKYCRSLGWKGRIGSMIEIPSAALCMEDLILAGATNFLIGLNDLSSLSLGRDRGDNRMKLNKAIWKIVNIVKKNSGFLPWGIAGSLSKEILEMCQRESVPYVSLHYGELNSLINIDTAMLPQQSHVKKIKEKTRQAKSK